MSVIYQPPGQPFNPLFQDCLENALNRQSPNATTSGTGVVTLYNCLIPAKSIDTDGKHFEFTVIGNLTGTLGTKRLVANIDGSAIFDTGALAQNNQNYYFKMIGVRLLGVNLQTYCQFLDNPSGAETITSQFQNVQQLNNFDFTIDHTFTIQGQVSNAGDNVSVIVAYGSVL